MRRRKPGRPRGCDCLVECDEAMLRDLGEARGKANRRVLFQKLMLRDGLF